MSVGDFGSEESRAWLIDLNEITNIFKSRHKSEQAICYIFIKIGI